MLELQRFRKAGGNTGLGTQKRDQLIALTGILILKLQQKEIAGN